jgi:hypothetical protein
VHYGQRRPQSVLDAVGAELEPAESSNLNGASHDASHGASHDDGFGADETAAHQAADRIDGQPDEDTLGRVVREKAHDAKPMSVDQALHEMELVGHDFYLFADAECGLPSVVYRRKGYAYGVIRLAAPVIAPPREPESATAPTTPVDGVVPRPAAFAARS